MDYSIRDSQMYRGNEPGLSPSNIPATVYYSHPPYQQVTCNPFQTTFEVKMNLPWKRLIRFITTDGRTLRGEPIAPDDLDLGFITEADQLQARVISGDEIYDMTGRTSVTDEIVTVKTLLGPLAREEVPILRCVGLNYAKHSEMSRFVFEYIGWLMVNKVREAGRTPPPFPFIFFKPNTTIHDHGVPVVIPKIAQDEQADYEGELVTFPSPFTSYMCDIKSISAS